MSDDICYIGGCDSPAVTIGICSKHYYRSYTRKKFGREPRPTVDMSVEERFSCKVNKTNTCWEWVGYVNKNGYGQFHVDRRLQFAHRFSYSLYVGLIPEGMHVLHKCDNPCCVNPDHLFIGNHQDNMDDMVSKNRHATGSANGRAKLTNISVVRIREMIMKGISQTRIAKFFNVNQATISGIKNGNTWGSVK